jgi:hypothetical protein
MPTLPNFGQDTRTKVSPVYGRKVVRASNGNVRGRVKYASQVIQMKVVFKWISSSQLATLQTFIATYLNAAVSVVADETATTYNNCYFDEQPIDWSYLPGGYFEATVNLTQST